MYNGLHSAHFILSNFESEQIFIQNLNSLNIQNYIELPSKCEWITWKAKMTLQFSISLKKIGAPQTNIVYLLTILFWYFVSFAKLENQILTVNWKHFAQIIARNGLFAERDSEIIDSFNWERESKNVRCTFCQLIKLVNSNFCNSFFSTMWITSTN